ncbi:MAG TPA: hypothetical protein VFM88_14540 [Vicinamibacteria bacterium]|nr:hypothetical protein [Vicinamibacteria bacterium]
MKNLARPLALALTLALAACGDDSGPTTPPPPLPNVAGTWGMQWLVQFHRNHDGFEGQYYCYGSMTLSQSATSGQSAALSGFTVVQGGCPQGTFDATGTLRPDGTLTLETVGPRPSQGQCPFVPAAGYEGQVSNNVLSARAEETVDCPGTGEGEHVFNYVVTAYKNTN